MSSIKKRSDRAGNKSFARRVDAENYRISIDGQKLAGAYIDPNRAKMTVGEVAEKWKASKVNLKATTKARNESALEVHVLPRWRSVPLAKVEYTDIQAWVAEMIATGLSGASVRKNYGVLSAILTLAVRDKRLAGNPATGVDLPPMNHKRRKYLTASKVAELAAAAAQPRQRRPKLATNAPQRRRPKRATDATFAQYRLAVFVLAYCGLRWSELAALKVARVDLMRRRIAVEEAVTEVNGGRSEWGTPKSNERRSVPIPDDLVFTAPIGGVLRNRTARRAWFDSAAEAIGEKGLTPHELRHTAASLAVSAGANVKAVQRMLGHKSAAMTLDVYSDLFDDDLDAVAERLDAVARAAAVAHLLPKGQISDLERMTRQAVGQ
jgi:integrase